MILIWTIISLVLFGVIGIGQSFADVVYTEKHELDFENCDGILDIEEIKSVIMDIGEITVSSRGLIPVDEEPDLQTMCVSTFESSGKTISMSIVVMDSTDAAITLYEKNLDSMSTQDFEIREYVTFWNNFDVVLNNQGLGSFMGSQYDRFFISFHTSFDEDNTPLIDVEELRVLSTIVQKKILDLDDVLISPPNPIPNLDDQDRFKPEHETPPIETGELLSPLKQFKNDIPFHQIECNRDLQLTQKYDGSPACVKSGTEFELIKRGWVSEIIRLVQSRDLSLDPEDIASSYMERITPTLDDFKNILSGPYDIDTIFSKFGDPHYDIGSGIHIYVYELNDDTQIWIGYNDHILYVTNHDLAGNVLEELFVE